MVDTSSHFKFTVSIKLHTLLYFFFFACKVELRSTCKCAVTRPGTSHCRDVEGAEENEAHRSNTREVQACRLRSSIMLSERKAVVKGA